MSKCTERNPSCFPEGCSNCNSNSHSNSSSSSSSRSSSSSSSSNSNSPIGYIVDTGALLIHCCV